MGGLTTAALVACGGSEPSGDTLVLGGEASTTPSRLAVRFPDGFRTPSMAAVDSGPQRFPFIIFADDGFPLVTDAPETIDIELLFDGESIAVETVERHGAGQFTPYYPLVFTPGQVGSYVARAEFSDLDVEFRVEARVDVPLLQVGDKLPVFDTPTFDDLRGVELLCTRTDPCPFHEVTLTEALSNGKPTALLIATPAFCQTDVCGPSVEFLIETAADRDDINVIHAEVFAEDPNTIEGGGLPELAPLLTEMAMTFEPSLFVTDASGTIVDARHYAIDRREFSEALAKI